MIDIETIKSMNRAENIALTKHARERLEDGNIMLCMKCGGTTEKGFTTDVTDLGSCLVIIRNVPCYKCRECSEVIYTADVVQRLEKLVETAKQFMQEISIIDYSKAA